MNIIDKEKSCRAATYNLRIFFTYEKLKMRYVINFHKILTPLVMLMLMCSYNNFRIGPLVYLAIHGTYCFNWCLKELVFPDKVFDEVVTIRKACLVFIGLAQYWYAGFLVVTKGNDPHNITIFFAIATNISGSFLHFTSDAQKFFTLAETRRLITNGFFGWSRNINYFGEIMTYISFALLAEHIVPFLVLLFMSIIVYIPQMRKKEKSLSLYELYQKYKEDTTFLVPKIY